MDTDKIRDKIKTEGILHLLSDIKHYLLGRGNCDESLMYRIEMRIKELRRKLTDLRIKEL